MKRLFYFLIFTSLLACKREPQVWLISSPSDLEFTQINYDGTTVIPNGRKLTPIGKSIITAPHPFGLTLSHDGNTAITANSGVRPLSITIVRNLQGEPEIQQIPPGPKTDAGVLSSVFMGLAVSPDNQKVYVAGGQENKIYIFNLENGESLGYLDCSYQDDSLDYSHGYIGDLVLSISGNTLYAVDQIGFRVVVIDTDTKLMKSIPVGRYPFGICLTPDEKRLYVANVGMFQYATIRTGKSDSAKVKLLDFPPFGFNTPEMQKGIDNDTMYVPGLGDPNVPESFSVFGLDVSEMENIRVISKTKTGHLVGALVEGIPAVGGSSPNSIVATDEYVFVSNGNNDNISVISTKKDTVVHTISLIPDERVSHFRGVIPFGLALNPDQNRLYVAESGINAVAVVDLTDFKVLGHIPTGWFPSKLEVTPDGKRLIVVNAKGFGSGPNGGQDFKIGPEGSYIGSLMKGSLQIIDIPNDKSLAGLTEQVIENNYRFQQVNDQLVKERSKNPVPLYPGEKKSPIKHIVFISKENRTYDEVFGQVENGDGDASIARYGENVSFYNHAKTDSVINTTVMVNHLQIAQNFAISDNFYVDSDVSADGHRWLVNTYPNEWCETATPASYGGNRRFRKDSKAPGVYAMNGAAGAVFPEDYNEAGSMWDHLERNDVDFYNFGFSVMFEPASYDVSYKYTGIKQYVNFPVPQPMFLRTSRTYPTYNTAIPDQFRIDQFIKEFNEKWINGPDTMPELITVIIPNDHGAGERPEAGYPFRESYMADNDLAVGRIVEYLSHTPYWKNMLIVITEDDAQNGVDHIDAHRSLLMLISPWVKRDYVSHVHYSFGSLFKTYWNILGLPYLNQYDAAANDLSDFFAEEPDYTPYNAHMVDIRIFDPQKALDPLDEQFNWKAVEEAPALDDVDDMIKESKENDKDRLEDRERR
ncbi:MAG TPA: bifunctional YncE family protein/alkaline phosphatase family protein [Bacteroidales bacterium]|nr:bifunctional YncE family protein/alkaline phosphatase family protein [Bacteroidales bacterium]